MSEKLCPSEKTSLVRMRSHCVRASCDLATLGDRPGKAVRRLCGDRTEIVQCLYSCRGVSAKSARKSCGARAGSVQRPRGDGAVTVRGTTIVPRTYDHCPIFLPK